MSFEQILSITDGKVEIARYYAFCSRNPYTLDKRDRDKTSGVVHESKHRTQYMSWGQEVGVAR